VVEACAPFSQKLDELLEDDDDECEDDDDDDDDDDDEDDTGCGYFKLLFRRYLTKSGANDKSTSSRNRRHIMFERHHDVDIHASKAQMLNHAVEQRSSYHAVCHVLVHLKVCHVYIASPTGVVAFS